MSYKMLLQLISAVILALTSCNKTPDTPSEPQEDPVLDPITVSRLKTSDGKTYLEVAGKPMALFGAQIRLDFLKYADQLKWDGIEEYFRLASELGVNCVQVPFTWAMLQPGSSGRYYFNDLDKVLEFSLKYGFKIELLWFSTNMIGDSYEHLVAPYIFNDKKYHLKRDGDGWEAGAYGKVHSLVFNDPEIMEREKQAITKLFNHTRYWDSTHGNTHPVITCQVHNETDGYARWRIEEKHICWPDGTPLTKAEAFKMTLDALNNAALAVKNSNYKVATRTNVIATDDNGINDFYQTQGYSPKTYFNLEGLDFISYDCYKDKIDAIGKDVVAYGAMNGNYPLIAENRGDYRNTPSLMLVAAALGGGYDIYDLATSPSVMQPPFDSEGVYDYTLEEKEHTPAVKAMLKGLTAASEEIAVTPRANFAAFNVKTDYPQQSIDQTANTTGATIRFQSECGTCAFALDRGDHITLYSMYDGCFTISGGTVPDYQGGVVPVKGGELYRINFVSGGKHSSNTGSLIGSGF